MAKKSMIAREVKRKKLVQKYAAKRKSLLIEFLTFFILAVKITILKIYLLV